MFDVIALLSYHVPLRSYMYRVVQKTDTQIYFGDNFGNSAPILNIFFHCYKQKFITCKRDVFPPTTPLLCDHLT